MATATATRRGNSAVRESAGTAAEPAAADRCPVTGAKFQFGQTIKAQWYWDDEQQKPVYADMAIPQVLRHAPTVAFMKWMKSIFYDNNRDMTQDRREVIQRALREHKFVETNDLAVVAGGSKPTLMNFHHRGTETLKFLESGGKIDVAVSVMYGLPFENIRYFDTGKNRSTMQIAKIMQQPIPPKSVPLVKVLFEMLADSKQLSPDEVILSIQSIESSITGVREMLGGDRRLRQPVVEAAFVSAYCHLNTEADNERKLEQLGSLALAMRSMVAETGDEDEASSADDPAKVTGNAILGRIALFEKGKKNGPERTTAFYLIQEGIYRFMKGERVLQLRPKVRGWSPQYPLPSEITAVTLIKSKFEEDDASENHEEETA